MWSFRRVKKKGRYEDEGLEVWGGMGEMKMEWLKMVGRKMGEVNIQ